MPVIWLIAGVLLAIAELFTADFVLIMLAFGAFAAAIASAVGSPLPIDILVFALVSIFGLVAARPAIKRRLHRGADTTRMGLEAMEGIEATVVEEVTGDRGLVKVGGELWSARPYDMTQIMGVGERVRVVEVKGATAMVWRETP